MSVTKHSLEVPMAMIPQEGRNYLPVDLGAKYHACLRMTESGRSLRKVLGMCLGVSSCAAKPAPSLRIVNPGPMFVLVEQSSWLRCYTENLEGKIQFEVENPEYVEVTPRGCCVGLKCGSTKVTAFVGEVSDSIEVHVLDPKVEPQSFGFYPKNGIYEGHVAIAWSSSLMFTMSHTFT